ncbi:MAG: hypothetical protein ACD_62C00521G0004 [uncultured bacterium]|nr:MAG: hypothetical protein ACD_62C00521G0004 [uncultured bacterium]
MMAGLINGSMVAAQVAMAQAAGIATTDKLRKPL